MAEEAEFIVDGVHGNYIRTPLARVPDWFLSQFINDRLDFSHVDVLCDNNEDDDLETFYDHIHDDPNLERFMDFEANSILSFFNDSHKNPEIKEKFFIIMANKIMGKLGIDSSFQEFEEFLDYKRNIKSARNV